MKNANPVSRVVGRGAAVVVLLAGLTACGQAQPDRAGPGDKATGGAAAEKSATVRPGATHWFEIAMGERRVEMQLAITLPEMQRGLMERRDLGAEQGMLFVYARPQRMSFWMRNTPTALDIGFFDQNGVLREVYPLHPYDETPVGSVREDLQYALEMNQGWFARCGVRVGQRLDMVAVAAAVRERGFPLRGFLGLNEAAESAAAAR
jgi:uncharacterized membrane protein (UPF0127 family)